jgi:hypothetical protein
MVPSIDSPTKEIRIIRKAKRIHRQNSGEGKAENGTPVPNNNKSRRKLSTEITPFEVMSTL